MLRKIAKLMAYKKAPKTAFAVTHPLKAAKYGAIYLVVKKALGR